MQHLLADNGFWTWLALLWFDQFCPVVNGVLQPSQPYNYILSDKYNHRPRHAVYMTWQLVDRHAKQSRFILCKSLSIRGELTEQLMARQKIISSEAAINVASMLYLNYEDGQYKRGAAARKSADTLVGFNKYNLRMMFFQ